MEIKIFFLLNFGSLLLNLLVSGIGFLATCLFNSAAKTTAVATGLPMFFSCCMWSPLSLEATRFCLIANI